MTTGRSKALCSAGRGFGLGEHPSSEGKISLLGIKQSRPYLPFYRWPPPNSLDSADKFHGAHSALDPPTKESGIIAPSSRPL